MTYQHVFTDDAAALPTASPEGRRTYYKGGGGGGKGAIGMVLAVVAAVFIPVAGAALATQMGMSTVLSTAMVGSAFGGVSAAITGGNIGKGMLMGGVTGAIGGAMQGVSAAGAADATAEAAAAGGMGSEMAGMTAADLAAANAGADTGLFTGAGGWQNAGNALSEYAQGGFDMSGAVDNSWVSANAPIDGYGLYAQGGFDAAGMTDNSFIAASANGAPEAVQGNWLSGAFENANLRNAAGKLAGAYVGSLAQSPYQGNMEDYLKYVQAQQEQALQFNMDMANRKAAIGDQLATNAGSMDPTYYARLAQNEAKNRDAATWLDTEDRMRRGQSSQGVIDSEARRAAVASSQNQATAYDSGYLRGVQGQNSTYGTAGSMYGQVSQPDSSAIVSGYNTLANQQSQAQSRWGSAIEESLKLLKKDTKETTM